MSQTHMNCHGRCRSAQFCVSATLGCFIVSARALYCTVFYDMLTWQLHAICWPCRCSSTWPARAPHRAASPSKHVLCTHAGLALFTGTTHTPCWPTLALQVQQHPGVHERQRARLHFFLRLLCTHADLAVACVLALQVQQHPGLRERHIGLLQGLTKQTKKHLLCTHADLAIVHLLISHWSCRCSSIQACESATSACCRVPHMLALHTC